MTERERLTTERRKIFARESLTLMSMPKEELRQHYNEIFDRLQEYEVAEENNQIIVLPVKVGDTVYSISRGQIIPTQIDAIRYTERGIDIYGSNEEYFGYSTIHLDINNQIGIKWYKTKEEAEKELEDKKKE